MAIIEWAVTYSNGLTVVALLLVLVMFMPYAFHSELIITRSRWTAKCADTDKAVTALETMNTRIAALLAEDADRRVETERLRSEVTHLTYLLMMARTGHDVRGSG